MGAIALTTAKQTIDVVDLNGFLGQNIKDICDCGFTDNAVNHCAHFVSHAMLFTFGQTCKGMTGKDGIGATVRVNEIYNHCLKVGTWSDKPVALTGCLAFVTSSGNVSPDGRMTDHPRKHIGIFLHGSIWHYSNTRDKVVTATPGEFAKHYPGSDITLYYGSFPI